MVKTFKSTKFNGKEQQRKYKNDKIIYGIY